MRAATKSWFVIFALLNGCGSTLRDEADGGRLDAAAVDAAGPVDAGAVDGARDSGPPPPCSRPVPDLSGERITTDPLDEPIFLSQPAGTDDLYVVERRGRIVIVRDGSVLAQPFLDITALTGGYGTTGGDERGLLGMAFHPDYQSNGRFFVYYANTSGPAANVVAEGRRSDDPDRAESELTTILSIDDFAQNHNGGTIAFGPDGFLYVGTGDGGGGGDPRDQGQDLGSLLGKMLRIDVDGTAPYGVPSDNPFVSDAAAEPEIWAYGLRNPWRWSFDRETGDLWIGDVGQNAWEEVDFQPRSSSGGENYGWNAFEGTREYAGGGPLRSGSTHAPPVYEYRHESADAVPADGVSVAGGYVYRGAAIPELRGVYVFADLNGTTGAFRFCDGEVTNVTTVRGLNALAGRYVYSFGEDADGELYVMFASGEVYRIVPAAP